MSNDVKYREERLEGSRSSVYPAHQVLSMQRETVAMHSIIEQNRARNPAHAERDGVINVRVFGAMARGDADDASNVDLLDSLPPEKTG